MAEPAAGSSVRLAELLAILSLATDLGMGQPMEHVLRQCLISLRLAQYAQDGRPSRRAHLRQDGSHQSRAGQPVRR